jgi:hypothetical protein
VVCLPCQSEAEVNAVVAYINTRGEMAKINISRVKPLIDAETIVSVFSRLEQPVWYGLTPGSALPASVATCGALPSPT